jgi:hypothetical protein
MAVKFKHKTIKAIKKLKVIKSSLQKPYLHLKKWQTFALWPGVCQSGGKSRILVF